MKRESETRRWKEVSFEETCKVPSIFQFEVEFFPSLFSIFSIFFIWRSKLHGGSKNLFNISPSRFVAKIF